MRSATVSSRDVIEYRGSRFSNYFLELETIFSKSENWERKPDDRPAERLKVYLSQHACYRLLDRLCIISRSAVCIPECMTQHASDD